MAAKGGNQKTRKANSMLTKTGKTRLGPLNISQLEKLLEGARKKHVPKITRALCYRMKTQQVSKKVVGEAVIAEVPVLVAEEKLQATE
jgi:ABC-type taurine transport system substrate-binding protein